MVFGSKATIGGVLRYSAPEQILIESGTVKGGIEFKKLAAKPTGENGLAGIFVLSLLVKILSVVVIALIAVAVFKKRSAKMVSSSFVGFGWNIFRGFSVLVLVPVAAVLFLITVLGAPLAIIAVAFYVAALVASGILAPVMVGSMIWKFFKKITVYEVNTYSILIGAVTYTLLSVIPFIGWVFALLFFLAAIGAIAKELMEGVSAARNGK
jgi:hypothetical protein